MLRAEAVASDLLHPAVIEGVNVVVYFCRAMLFCWCTTARLMVGSRVVEVGGCERRPLALTFSMLQMFSLLRQFQSLDGDVKVSVLPWVCQSWILLVHGALTLGLFCSAAGPEQDSP